jgi:hypothetical protein
VPGWAGRSLSVAGVAGTRVSPIMEMRIHLIQSPCQAP